MAPGIKQALGGFAALGAVGGALVAAGGGVAAGSGVAALNIASAGGAAIPAATNPRLQNTISALFRAGDRIAGGTAGAIRHEALTGDLVGGKPHLQKGIERIANLERIIRSQHLDQTDMRTAQRLLEDLRSAVAFAENLKK